MSYEILIVFGKVVAALAVIIGFYFIAEEQLEVSSSHKRRSGPSGVGGGSLRRRLIEKLTGGGFEDQLIEALLMISSCLKAGRNLDQAFDLVAVSTPAPLCDEFRTLVQERRLGTSMVDALTNLARRVPSQDLRLAVNATIFQQETGGNLEDLYRQITMTVSERKKVMGKVIAGTAHARLSGNLVGIIPVFIALGLAIVHPAYLAPMLLNPIGQIVLITSICMSLMGMMIINRMTTNLFPEPEDAMYSLTGVRPQRGTRWRLIRPIAGLFGSFIRLLPTKYRTAYRDEVNSLLTSCGNPADFSPEEFVGAKFLWGIGFGALSVILFSYRAFGIWSLLFLAVWFIIGFALPDVYVKRLIRRRQQNIEYELPYTIDLLSLSIEAGLDLIGGMQRIVEKSRPTDIVMEFQMFLSEIKLGKSLEEALAEMADRVQVLSFFSFVSSLIQAQRLGAEIGPTLRAQAEQMRYQRMILAEEKVNQLPVKLLFPLVFFIFPSIFVMVMGPSFLHLAQNLAQAIK